MSWKKTLALPPQMEMICLDVSLLIFYRQQLMLRYFLNLVYTTITKDTLGVLILFGRWSIPIKAICIWMLWRAEYSLGDSIHQWFIVTAYPNFFRLLLIKCKQPKSLIAAPQSTCIQMKFSVRVFNEQLNWFWTSIFLQSLAIIFVGHHVLLTCPWGWNSYVVKILFRLSCLV